MILGSVGTFAYNLKQTNSQSFAKSQQAVNQQLTEQVSSIADNSFGQFFSVWLFWGAIGVITYLVTGMTVRVIGDIRDQYAFLNSYTHPEDLTKTKYVRYLAEETGLRFISLSLLFLNFYVISFFTLPLGLQAIWQMLNHPTNGIAWTATVLTYVLLLAQFYVFHVAINLYRESRKL